MRHFALLLAFLLLLSARASAQTTHQVDLAGVSFSPASLTIAEGDTVVWNWVSGFHNVASDDGFFRSGAPTGAPNTFSITFDASFLAAMPANGNVYGYHCEPHQALGMTGAVTVTTGRPVLTITGFNAGATAAMTVTGATGGGTVGYAYSLAGPGPSTVNAGPCGPVLASLSAPFTLLPFVNADAAGVAVLNVNVPPAAAGLKVWVQAMDLAGCQLSNGATMTVG